MGRAKEEMMKYIDLGFKKPDEDENICSNHFTDYAIVDFIESNGENEICSFCKLGEQNEKVVPFEEFIRFLSEGIYFFYGDAANEGLAFESAEGGYQGDLLIPMI